MNALEAALLVAILLLPLHLVVQWQIARLTDPGYVRRCGVVMDQDNEPLEARTQLIGHYWGKDIYERVQYMGLQYRFDRVVKRSYREWVQGGELYLEPGLVYVAE